MRAIHIPWKASGALAGALLCTVCASVTPAGAWWPEGHSIIARGAVKALPVEMPAFFREGGPAIGHFSYDPDVAKSRDAPLVRNQEEPEHYIDWELLQGRPLPANRYQFLKLCRELGQEPDKVGTLPYSTAEWTERLAVAFAEHRRWPDNPHIRMKCLVYAGFLAHYTGDLCMPLHTTLHFDGRAKEDGTSPRTGIHARVDSLIEKVGLKPEELAEGQKIVPAEALLPAIVKQIENSRSLIEKTYALEASLPPERGDWAPSAEVRAFTLERGRESARFMASLYLTSWRKSARITLPPWVDRAKTDPVSR